MTKHQSGTAPNSFSGRRFSLENDMDAVLRLYEDVFQRSADPDLWKWKYQPPWIRESYAWLGVHDGKIIGHVGAVPLRGLLNGEEVFFFQFGDIMVSPDVRSMALYLQWDPKSFIAEIRSDYPHAVLYGFTSRKLARFYTWYASSVQNTHSEWANDQLVRCLPEESDGETHAPIRIQEWSWQTPELDDIWLRQKETISVGLIRDRAYLEWRYANQPLIDYSLFGVYNHDEPVGWLVTGKRGLADPWDDEVRVHDMLIAPEMRLPVLQKAASLLHAQSLVLWLPAHCVDPGMESRESNWKVMYHPACDTVSQEFLSSNIYYTLGEADEWWW